MSSARPRLTIPTRIFFSFVLVLTAFGAVSATSLWQHQRTAQTLRLLHEGYLPLALAIGQIKATQAVYGTMLDRVLSERDPTSTREWLSAARDVRPVTLRRAISRLERAEALAPPPDDREALSRLRQSLRAVQEGYAEAHPRFDALFHATAEARSEDAERELLQLRLTEQEVARRLRRASNQVQAQIASTSRRSAEQEREMVLVVAILVLGALAAGLIVTWWSNRLLAPLPRLMRRVAAVAKGDFAPRMESARDDEIGHLAREFERMVDAVGARDRQLREAADTLRELQQMQEQIVAGLRAAVVVVDGDGVIRSANRAARSVLGVGKDAVGIDLAASGLLQRLEPLAPAIDGVAGGGPPATLTAATLGEGERGGGARAVDVFVTRFGSEEPGDARRAVLIVADDVTEALRTKTRLIQTERLAAIGRMAAHVTHEVRNPLSSMGLNAELLEEELADAAAEPRALLRAITREIDRLTGITEEYLRLARLPAPRFAPEDVGAVAGEVGRFVQREMEASSVSLEVAIDEDLPPVAADEAQVRQALLNLLRNARESMPSGGKAVLRARAEDGGVALSVTDQGPGIPEGKREHVFDLFYSTKERGTGLGLALTQQIVEAHGGKVRCGDAPDGGAVFTLWFPAAPPVAAGAERDESRAESEPPLAEPSPFRDQAAS